MLIQKTNPQGPDWAIDKLAAKLYARLTAVWPAGIEWDCYNRAYRNKTDDGYVAEVYDTAGEYKEVYHNDSVAVTSFFGLGENIKIGVENTVEGHLVFFADLALLKPSTAHRADIEVQNDVLNVIGSSLYGIKPTGVQTGIENVLREYPGSRRDERLKYVDMHPIHAFRVDFELTYKNKTYCPTGVSQLKP